jgi:hypothetical protein
MRRDRSPLAEAVVWTFPPVAAGGCCRAPSMDMDRTEAQATFPRKRHDDARADELNNLRLALATFALQLDAFELRTREGLLRAGIRPGTLDPAASYRLEASEEK